MSSWSLAFPQQPGHVGEVQDLGVLGQKAGESIGIENSVKQGKWTWVLVPLAALAPIASSDRKKADKNFTGQCQYLFFQD